MLRSPPCSLRHRGHDPTQQPAYIVAAGAASAGAAYGAAAQALIAAAVANVNINVNNTGGAKVDTGTHSTTEGG